MSDINNELLKVQKEWIEAKLLTYMGGQGTDCDEHGRYKKSKEQEESLYLSCPFYMGVTDEYVKRTKSRRVMIIGQEARHYGTWKDNRNDFGYTPEESQQWAIEYLLCQLDTPKQNSRFNHKYNHSRFWSTFRTLSDNDINVCWNNIDKVYFSRGNIDYKGTLSYEGEEYLSAQYGSDNLSLLQREIKISTPDALLFVTGPKYYLSMAKAFDIAPDKFEERLNKDSKIVNITDILHVGKPAFWTYHPANQLGINSAQEFLEAYKKCK
ncbi:MAG: hypothetical protein J1E81_10065 [Eubacterium sp.]|nr:hypothetical protein [Eubacterium sp.]